MTRFALPLFLAASAFGQVTIPYCARAYQLGYNAAGGEDFEAQLGVKVRPYVDERGYPDKEAGICRS